MRRINHVVNSHPIVMYHEIKFIHCSDVDNKCILTSWSSAEIENVVLHIQKKKEERDDFFPHSQVRNYAMANGINQVKV